MAHYYDYYYTDCFSYLHHPDQAYHTINSADLHEPADAQTMGAECDGKWLLLHKVGSNLRQVGDFPLNSLLLSAYGDECSYYEKDRDRSYVSVEAVSAARQTSVGRDMTGYCHNRTVDTDCHMTLVDRQCLRTYSRAADSTDCVDHMIRDGCCCHGRTIDSDVGCSLDCRTENEKNHSVSHPDFCFSPLEAYPVY